MIAVSLLIVSNPKEISWRVIDLESNRQQFGYRPGWYETTGFSVSTILLSSGRWEFVLSRTTTTTTSTSLSTGSRGSAILDFGILNPETGLIESIASLDLQDPDGSSDTVTTIFSL
jgi:hypothetical protein